MIRAIECYTLKIGKQLEVNRLNRTWDIMSTILKKNNFGKNAFKVLSKCFGQA